jgi:hypothetical protein
MHATSLRLSLSTFSAIQPTTSPSTGAF